MISHRIIIVLVGGFALLLVAFAVIMAFYALIVSLGDAPAGKVLFWIAMGALILLITDVVLLVGALGLRAVQQQDRS